MPLADRRGSTGMLARRVSEFESVRDFFASTTIVLIVDLLFLFLFLIMIAVLAGWLALVPLAIIAVMGVAGFFLQRQMMKDSLDHQADMRLQRSEARSGGEECASTSRTRWSSNH